MTKQIREKTNRVSCIVFALTLVVVVINLVSVFFPALIVTLTSGSESQINPFEPGAWAIPVLVTNAVFFCFVILYYEKSLPNAIRNSIKFILNFEISRKVAAIVIIILLGGYIAFTVQDLSIYEGGEFGDFKNIENFLKQYSFIEFEGLDTNAPFVKYFLLDSSETVFQNIKIIPFLASISLLLLTYFFTLEISKKRFAGIVSMIILLQSSLFLRYDTSATYSNFWILFYLLSLYLLYKKWFLSPVAYFLSLFSKPLTAIFLPMTLFLTYRAEIPKGKKIRITISYVIIFVIIIGIILPGIFSTDIISDDIKIGDDSRGYLLSKAGKITMFNYSDFWSGLTTWAFQLRFDWLVLLFLLPLTVCLFLMSRKGILESDSVLVLIVGALLSIPLLSAFTNFNLHPYRYIPLVVFFAVGVGTLLSKRINQQV